MIGFLLLAATPAATVASPPARTTVAVAGLRNAKGSIRVCLTRNPHHFPDCSGDPAALSRTVPASAATIDFGPIEPGDYAICVLHDENDNRKLDTALGIPREGFGFSHNPKIRFGAPRFADVVVRIGPGVSREDIRIRYLF